MNTTTVRPHSARRRHRSGAGLLLIGPTVAAAVVLSAAPQVVVSMFGPPSPSPTTDSGEQIELVHTSREWLPLKPRGEGQETETAEDVWAPIPGGPGASGRLSESTIKSECKDAGGSYVTDRRTGGGNTFRFSSCTYTDIGGATYRDFYTDGRWQYTTPVKP